MQQLVLFMNFYLKDLQRSGNPYILGYSLTTTDKTNYDPDQNVPDALKPTGTTFTLYHDPVNANLSNLNFVLATKGGHGKIVGTPGNFDSNWIAPTEQCDAKMIYSHSCLVEKFILRPFFDQLRSGVRPDQGQHQRQRRQRLRQREGATATGYAYTISEPMPAMTSTSTHSPPISAAAAPASRSILKGHLEFYKAVDKDMGV